MIATTTSALDHARDLHRRGFTVIPVPSRQKKPVLTGWPNLRMTESELPKYFNGQPSNIGILLGEPSGWLIDIDLDHPQAVALAREYLPGTCARFGREGKPESHWLYRVRQPVVTKKFQTSDKLMLVELRSSGCQTIGPGSIHTSGEAVRWDADGAPTEVDPDELMRAVERLAKDTADAIGVTLATDAKPKCARVHNLPASGGMDNREDRAWAYILKCPDAISGQGGHDATLHVACECIRFDLNDAAAWRVMLRFNAEKCKPPWTEKELWHKVEDAQLKAGHERGMRLENSAHRRRTKPLAEPPEVETKVAPKSGAPLLDDIGNAQRFARQHAENVKYVAAWKKWLVWDGMRWKRDDVGVVIELAKATARGIYSEAARAARAGKDDLAKRLSDHAKASASRAKLDAMLALAQSDPQIAIRPDALDIDLILFNVENGTIDLRTGKLREHRRADLITKIAPVEYNPDAKCPRFDAFLDRIMDRDASLISFLWRAVGYTLTGQTGERVMFILHGPGANGKTVFIETLAALLGDYAMTIPAATLLQHRNDHRPRNDLAALQGARFVPASETAEGNKLDEAMAKQITGGDMIAARFLFAEFFQFLPAFKLWLSTNHKPEIRGDDDAIWARIRLVPFGVVIPEHERDTGLKGKLREDLPGILSRAIQGCLDWQRDGLAPPGKVVEATGEYRAEQDNLTAFIEECCVVADGVSAGASQVFKAYTDWCERSGVAPVSQTAFGRRLSDKGFQSEKCPATRRAIRRGIGVRDEGVTV